MKGDGVTLDQRETEASQLVIVDLCIDLKEPRFRRYYAADAYFYQSKTTRSQLGWARYNAKELRAALSRLYARA